MKHKIRDEIQKAGFWLWFWSVLFSVVVSIYVFQPDFAFALTVYSPWVPAILGGLGAVFTCLKRGLRAVAMIGLLWIGWGLIASEEFHGLARRTPGEADFRGFQYEGSRMRIVSLNCAGGTIEAVQEIKSFEPDILLLQETPSKSDLEVVAKEMFGKGASMVVGPDAAILSRYPLRSWNDGKREPSNFVGAFAKIGENESWMVVSLRLQPPVLRFDYWNPDCWSDYANGKQKRRRELQEVWKEVRAIDDDWILVMGGDFNAPPDRSIREILEPRVYDSARIAGKGWGMTAVSQMPLVRIDQIWLDHRLVPLRTISVHNNRSDHRTVVSDFMRGS